MNKQFIRTDNQSVIAELERLGFYIVSENNGITTFVNNPEIPLHFSADKKLIYTNKLEV